MLTADSWSAITARTADRRRPHSKISRRQKQRNHDAPSARASALRISATTGGHAVVSGLKRSQRPSNSPTISDLTTPRSKAFEIKDVPRRSPQRFNLTSPPSPHLLPPSGTINDQPLSPIAQRALRFAAGWIVGPSKCTNQPKMDPQVYGGIAPISALPSAASFWWGSNLNHSSSVKYWYKQLNGRGGERICCGFFSWGKSAEL